MIKLKELLEKYSTDIHFHKEVINSETKCENGEIIIKYTTGKPYVQTIKKPDGTNYEHIIDLKDAFQPDTKVELNCFWYYGGLAEARREGFELAFKTKDYKLFKDVKKVLLNTESYWCSPQSIVLSIDGKPFGHIDYIDEFLFQHIDFQECEHG